PRKLERSMPIQYLRRSTIAQQYRSELAQQLSTCTGSASVDEAWQNVKEAMLAAFSAVCPTSPIRPQNHWISARSLSMIDARKSIPAGNALGRIKYRSVGTSNCQPVGRIPLNIHQVLIVCLLQTCCCLLSLRFFTDASTDFSVQNFILLRQYLDCYEEVTLSCLIKNNSSDVTPFSAPNYHATRRKHEDFDTAALFRPTQERSRCREDDALRVIQTKPSVYSSPVKALSEIAMSAETLENARLLHLLSHLMQRFPVSLNDFLIAGNPQKLLYLSGRTKLSHIHAEVALLIRYPIPSNVIDFVFYCI
ncbi:hypothetical protein CLF_106151, partial [Clonorchis sinensis]